MTGRIRPVRSAAVRVAAMMAVCAATAVAAWLIVGGAGGQSRPHVHTVAIGAGHRPSLAQAPSTMLPAVVPHRSGELAADLARAEQVIARRSSSPRALAAAGLFEELATGALEGQTATARRATLALLSPQARASMQVDLAAAAALSGLAEHRRRLPPWQIIAPPPPPRLLGYFRAAQARYHVPWQYLAAIELVETTFGRIRGPSSAGAQGPMQFVPATWATYGRGSIDNPRDAILAAARYLAANGAPGDMADALYHYNNSRSYVAAVRDYATRMQRSPRAYDGYYYWQVIYSYAGHTVILPVGFPRVRPVPVGP
jgi:Transglycosylase SLT domain